MKITIFTGQSNRHKFLIKMLQKHELYIVTEEKKSFSYLSSSYYKKNKLEVKYFEKVKKMEKKIFGRLQIRKKNFKEFLSLKVNSLNNKKINYFKKFLRSDLYIVYGSSIIKGELLNYLVKKKCINIHLGVSPYYRGSNCNFWAIIDKRYNLVGSTIHLLSSKVDQGKILYHALPEHVENPFAYSMAAVKSAIMSIANNINKNQLSKFKPIIQNVKKQVRFTKNSDLKAFHFMKYPKKIKFIKNNPKLYIKPHILKKKDIYDKKFKI